MEISYKNFKQKSVNRQNHEIYQEEKTIISDLNKKSISDSSLSFKFQQLSSKK